MTLSAPFEIRLVGDHITDRERNLVQRAVEGALAARDEQWAEHVQTITQAVADAVAQQIAQNTPRRSLCRS